MGLEIGPGRTERLQLPVIPDRRGNLTFLEGNRQIPFPISRVYYLYDVPTHAVRGGHAHKALHQLLIAIAGSFVVLTDNGTVRAEHTLNNAGEGLYIGPLVWRELHGFSSGSVCLVLASMIYDEEDYFRDYDTFRAALNT